MKPRATKALKIAAAAVVLIAVGAGLAWLLEPRENSSAPAPAHPTEARARPAASAAPGPSGESARPHSPFDSRLPKKNLIRPVNPTAPPGSVPPVAPPPGAPAPASPPLKKTKEPIQDELARVMLSFVGVSEEAEEYWTAAINNPDLPANERKDLIEDLNEDGFPDPKNLTADDLPLIESRIDIIENLMLDPLDETNAAALAEAYKDLIIMRERVPKQ